MSKKIVFGIVAGTAVVGGALITAICRIVKDVRTAEEYKAEAMIELDEAKEICEEASGYLEDALEYLDESKRLMNATKILYGIDTEGDEDDDDEFGDC